MIYYYLSSTYVSSGASEASRSLLTLLTSPSITVFSFLERKKENQITEVTVKEENEVILDRQTEVIGIMEFLQKGKYFRKNLI
jgi:hypothetical protein